MAPDRGRRPAAGGGDRWPIPVDATIANISGHWNVDLRRPPDTRLSELGQIEGTRSVVEAYTADGDGPSLAEVASHYLNIAGQESFVGTPEKVAETFQRRFKEGAIDDSKPSPQWYAPDYFWDIVDLLIPELQRRGVTRTS